MDRLAFGWKMYSHYARFNEIRAGAVLPARPAHRRRARGRHPADRLARGAPDDHRPGRRRVFRDTWAYKPMVACNETYTALVDTVYRSFNGEPALLREEAVPKMYELKYQAMALLNMPSPLQPDRTLGPAFQYLAPAS